MRPEFGASDWDIVPARAEIVRRAGSLLAELAPHRLGGAVARAVSAPLGEPKEAVVLPGDEHLGLWASAEEEDASGIDLA